ncbi:competence type IV pilus minor pilin ComGD [Jeotgalibacillus proteolyticus]|nr:competence type IV pilus minor pilin ComGD [Jeotgalibacillus proteolyticus]
MGKLESLNLLNTKGFTLIELMVVLLMVSIILSISTAFVFRTYELEEEIRFKNQIVKDLYNAQLVAITGKEPVRLHFYPRSGNYYIFTGSGSGEKLLVKRDFPQTVEMLESSTLTSFWFLPSGSTNTFGVMRFKIKNASFAIHYYLGKGRFYVVEE